MTMDYSKATLKLKSYNSITTHKVNVVKLKLLKKRLEK